MSDWRERLTADLELKLRVPDPRPLISAYHDMPYAIFRYPPEEEFAVRGEVRLLVDTFGARLARGLRLSLSRNASQLLCRPKAWMQKPSRRLRSALAWTFECAACQRQTSVTAGTVLHGSKLPLTAWFWAAYLMATHSNGISALQLQKQLGLGSYKSAWLLCAKLRRAMVAPNRALLSGLVEIDETEIVCRSDDDPLGGGGGREPVAGPGPPGCLHAESQFQLGRTHVPSGLPWEATSPNKPRRSKRRVPGLRRRRI